MAESDILHNPTRGFWIQLGFSIFLLVFGLYLIYISLVYIGLTKGVAIEEGAVLFLWGWREFFGAILKIKGKRRNSRKRKYGK